MTCGQGSCRTLSQQRRTRPPAWNCRLPHGLGHCSNRTHRYGHGPFCKANLEGHLGAAIDHAAVERRPRIDRPASVDRPCRAYERVPIRLLHVAQILEIEKQTKMMES